jgi:hypothetical protein
MCFWMRSCEMQRLALKLAKFISTDLINPVDVLRELKFAYDDRNCL